MSEENAKTIAVYEEYAEAYLAGNARRVAKNLAESEQKRARLKEFIRESIAGLPTDTKYLELGSGDGADVEIFRELGIEITPSDAPESFLKIMRDKGLNPLRLNLLVNELPDGYGCVYAKRVFVHFTEDDTKKILQSIYQKLLPGGRFIFNVINREAHDGKAEEWVDFYGDYNIGTPRYYKYWYENEIRDLLVEDGFIIKTLFKDSSDAVWSRKEGESSRWIYIVAEKPKEEVR